MDDSKPEAALPGTQVRDAGHDAAAGQDGREARARRRVMRRLRRHPWLSGVAGLVVAAAIAAAVLVGISPRYGEQVTGPAGPYPAVITPGGGAPRVLLTAPGRVVVTGGLAVEVVPARAGAIGEGVAAVSLRTGRKYWSYSRPGHAVADTATDESTDYVLWDDGLLTSIDPRTARVRWHASANLKSLGGDVLIDAPGQGRPVLLIGDTGAEAVSAASGARAWTVSAPRKPAGASDSCRFENGWPAVTGPTLTLAIFSEASCDGYYGYSLATGRLQWHYKPRQGSSQMPIPVGNGQVLATAPAGSLSAVVLDATTGRPGLLVGSDDLITSAGDGRAGEVDETTVTILSTSTGRIVWQAAPPASLTLVGRELRLGDRVYVTAESRAGSGPQHQWWLLAFDPGSGRLLSRDKLPSAQDTSAPGVLGAVDPEVTGSWPGGVLTITGTSDATFLDQLPTLVMAVGS